MNSQSKGQGKSVIKTSANTGPKAKPNVCPLFTSTFSLPDCSHTLFFPLLIPSVDVCDNVSVYSQPISVLTWCQPLAQCLLSYWKGKLMNLFQCFHPKTKRWGWVGGIWNPQCPYSAIHLSSAAPALLSPEEEPAPLSDVQDRKSPSKWSRWKNGISYSLLQTPWNQCLCGRMEKHQNESRL